MTIAALNTLINATAQNGSQFKGLTAAYGILLGGTPSTAGYTALINQNNTTNFGAGGTTVFNDENVYINTINALYQGNPTAKTTFDAIVASAATIQDALTLVYNFVIPTSARTEAGLNFFKSQATFFAARAAELGVAGTNGTALVAFASLTKIAVDNDIGGLGDTINDLRAAVANGTAAIPVDGTVFTPLETADGAQFDVDDVAGGGSNQGQTYNLTVPVENIPGTAGNDTINGVIVVGTAANTTYSAGDSINGGAGTDTFNVIVDQTDATNAGVSIPVVGTTITGIETLSIQSTGNNAGDTITVNAGSIAGLSTVNVTMSGTAAVATLNSTSNVTAMSVTGATNAVISDAGTGTGATADRLATVSLTGATFTGNSTIGSDALTTLNLTTTSGNATVTAATGTRALALNLNGVTGGTITDATATSVNVASSGAAVTGVTLANAAATAVNINAAVATTFADIQASAATAITASGAGAVTIAALTAPTALTSVTAGAGGLTVTPALAAGVLFTGDAGNDSVSLSSGFTRAITMGGGNDTVTYGGAAGTGGSVVAGDGTDIVVMTSAQAATASGSATFNSTFSGFEVLRLGTITNGDTINLAGINGVNSVQSSVGPANTEAVVLNGYTSGGTLTLRADAAGTGTYTVGVNNALVTAGDVFNIGLSSTTALATADIVNVAGVETINISTADASTAVGGSAAVVHTLALQATAATTVTVTGNNGLTLTNTGNTAITRFDASGVVANGTAGLDTPGNLGVTFLSANATASANVVIIGGTGHDVLVGNAAIDNISGGAGNDRLGGEAGTLAAAVAEVQTLTITGAATGAGNITVGGAAVAVLNGDSATVVAGKIAAAQAAIITANANIASVTANGADVVVTYQAFAGNVGNIAFAAGGTGVTAAAVVETTAGVVPTIGANTSSDTLTGGAGNDIFHFSAGGTTAIADVITDLTLGTNVVGGRVDQLVFDLATAGVATVISVTGAIQTNISGAANLDTAVNVALAAAAAANNVAMFTYGTDTYIVANGDGNATYTVGQDVLIKVTGVTGVLDASDVVII